MMRTTSARTAVWIQLLQAVQPEERLLQNHLSVPLSTCAMLQNHEVRVKGQQKTWVDWCRSSLSASPGPNSRGTWS